MSGNEIGVFKEHNQSIYLVDSVSQLPSGTFRVEDILNEFAYEILK